LTGSSFMLSKVAIAIDTCAKSSVTFQRALTSDKDQTFSAV